MEQTTIVDNKGRHYLPTGELRNPQEGEHYLRNNNRYGEHLAGSDGGRNIVFRGPRSVPRIILRDVTPEVEVEEDSSSSYDDGFDAGYAQAIADAQSSLADLED